MWNQVPSNGHQSSSVKVGTLNSQSNHSSSSASPAASPSSASLPSPALSSPFIARLQDRFQTYRLQNNDQEDRYKKTAEIMNEKSLNETKILLNQFQSVNNNAKSNCKSSKGAQGIGTGNNSGTTGSNKGTNKRSRPGQSPQLDKGTDGKEKLVSLPKLAKLTPKVTPKLEPKLEKIKSPENNNSCVKSNNQSSQPLLIPKVEPNTTTVNPPINPQINLQSNNQPILLVPDSNGQLIPDLTFPPMNDFSLDALTENIRDDDLLRLYEELGGQVQQQQQMYQQQQVFQPSSQMYQQQQRPPMTYSIQPQPSTFQSQQMYQPEQHRNDPTPHQYQAQIPNGHGPMTRHPTQQFNGHGPQSQQQQQQFNGHTMQTKPTGGTLLTVQRFPSPIRIGNQQPQQQLQQPFSYQLQRFSGQITNGQPNVPPHLVNGGQQFNGQPNPQFINSQQVRFNGPQPQFNGQQSQQPFNGQLVPGQQNRPQFVVQQQQQLPQQLPQVFNGQQQQHHQEQQQSQQQSFPQPSTGTFSNNNSSSSSSSYQNGW